jgi:hypothetical protein
VSTHAAPATGSPLEEEGLRVRHEQDEGPTASRSLGQCRLGSRPQ